MENSFDSITVVLEDIIIHHLFLDDLVILALMIAVFWLYIKKKLSFGWAIIFDLGLLAFEIIAIINGARLAEWATWYVKDGYLNKFRFEMYLEEIVAVLVIISMIIKYYLLKRKK